MVIEGYRIFMAAWRKEEKTAGRREKKKRRTRCRGDSGTVETL